MDAFNMTWTNSENQGVRVHLSGDTPMAVHLARTWEAYSISLIFFQVEGPAQLNQLQVAHRPWLLSELSPVHFLVSSKD